MLKRFCDRCGKRVGEKWYNVDIVTHDAELPVPTLAVLGCGCLTNVNDKPQKRDYCQACMDEFREFLKDKKA